MSTCKPMAHHRPPTTYRGSTPPPLSLPPQDGADVAAHTRQQLARLREETRHLRERIEALRQDIGAARGHSASAVADGADARVDAAAQAANGVLHLAEHDVLTDMPNRLLLFDRLEQAIEAGRRHLKRVGVLFLDLDGFKAINDSAGHCVGDQLLYQAAKRLSSNVRGSDTVSRYGGDEFVILLSEIDQPEDAAVAAGKMIAAISAAYNIEGRDYYLSASVGVSIYPQDAADPQSLIEMADTAMYRAKAGGGGAYQFFS
ncbi:MAG TPA: diguanylate cyclase [Rhodanobacteraceae bacterium]|nr:diguanylate cyclase [Rhodanobacteraceae bacterium]